MIILKIGGSILTEKDSAEPKVDYENLNRIAEEIRESLYAEEIAFSCHTLYSPVEFSRTGFVFWLLFFAFP